MNAPGRNIKKRLDHVKRAATYAREYLLWTKCSSQSCGVQGKSDDEGCTESTVPTVNGNLWYDSLE